MPDAHTYGAQSPSKLVGVAVVGLLHVGVVYALVSGLARKVVDVVLPPVEVQLIQEIKAPPPPPPKPLVVQQQVARSTPPPYVPPPEVSLPSPPPVVAETVTVSTPTPPRSPVPVPPSPEPVVVAPPAPVAPAVVSVGVACPTRVLPRVPPRLESVAGSVRARLTIRGGKVVQVDIVSSNPRGVFDSIVRNAVLQYSCAATTDGSTQIAEQAFEFTPL